MQPASVDMQPGIVSLFDNATLHTYHLAFYMILNSSIVHLILCVRINGLLEVDWLLQSSACNVDIVSRVIWNRFLLKITSVPYGQVVLVYKCFMLCCCVAGLCWCQFCKVSKKEAFVLICIDVLH